MARSLFVALFRPSWLTQATALQVVEALLAAGFRPATTPEGVSNYSPAWYLDIYEPRPCQRLDEPFAALMRDGAGAGQQRRQDDGEDGDQGQPLLAEQA